MPVDTTHIGYKRFLPIWTKNADATSGQDAIKSEENMQYYLPTLEGMKISTNPGILYRNYLEYATWYGASGRTVTGLLGLVYRKEPTINLDEQSEEIKTRINNLFKNFDGKGSDVTTFSKFVTDQVLQKNRVGILVDFPDVDTEDLSEAEMEELDVHPYANIYYAEAITNWRTTIVNGKEKTTMVVLRENISEISSKDQFEVAEKEQYRVLFIGEDGFYHQQVWERVTALDNSTAKYQAGPEITPLMNDEPLTDIPFYNLTQLGVSWDLKYPVINDLVDMNIAHYRNSANYENGLLLTGNPTPCVSMLKTQEGQSTIRFGSSSVLEFLEGGEWGFLEFEGKGMDTLKDAMNEKEKLMATLGARILSADKRMVESAETAMIHRSGEQSILANLAGSVSKTITDIIALMLEWDSVEPATPVTFELNKDYNPFLLDAGLLGALDNSRVSGGMSWETYFWNLQKGELVPSDVDMDEERKRIEEQAPEPLDLDNFMQDKDGNVTEEDKNVDE